MCSAKNRPKESMLNEWYTGSFKEIAPRKRDHMSVDEFEELLDELPAAFDHMKPLCKKMRVILFPLLKDGALFIQRLSHACLSVSNYTVGHLGDLARNGV